MPEIDLDPKVKANIDSFVSSLKGACGQNLVSAVLYGSAASGEFIGAHSNLNIMVVLEDCGLEKLKGVSALLNKRPYRAIQPVFLTKEYIESSTDVFPIEFLDMRENHVLLAGKDLLAEINIDSKNLRFQCERDIKVQLIALRQGYLKLNRDKRAIKALLFRSFSSVVHVLRSFLKSQGGKPAYAKEDALAEIGSRFGISLDTWKEILAAKNKKIRLDARETERVFMDFVKDLEKAAQVLDKA